jgi:hypothetical protein
MQKKLEAGRHRPPASILLGQKAADTDALTKTIGNVLTVILYCHILFTDI